MKGLTTNRLTLPGSAAGKFKGGMEPKQALQRCPRQYLLHQEGGLGLECRRGSTPGDARGPPSWPWMPRLRTRQSYQVLVAVLGERLLLLVLVLGPAVGHHVVHDGRVVDGLRLTPGHLQRGLVQRLHFHVDGRGAADWTHTAELSARRHPGPHAPRS